MTANSPKPVTTATIHKFEARDIVPGVVIAAATPMATRTAMVSEAVLDLALELVAGRALTGPISAQGP
jgi:hypothetical protein